MKLYSTLHYIDDPKKPGEITLGKTAVIINPRQISEIKCAEVETTKGKEQVAMLVMSSGYCYITPTPFVDMARKLVKDSVKVRR